MSGSSGGQLTFPAIGGSGGAIGDDVGGGTVGAMLYVGAGALLAQDPTNLFYDETNKRVGIGTNAPATALHVVGTVRASAGLTLDFLTAGSVVFAGASGAVAQDNANLFYDDTNNRLGIGNAAPTTTLDVTGTTRTTNATITAMTQGSVLFAGASGAVSQDNATYFWDNTNKRLGVGTAAPARSLTAWSAEANNTVGELKSTINTGISGTRFVDNTGVERGWLGYANANVTQTALQSSHVWWVSGTIGDIRHIQFANTTAVKFKFGMDDQGTCIEMATGDSAGTASTNTGRIRYNNVGTKKWQLSVSTGLYADIMTWDPSGPTASGAGAVAFIATSYPQLNADVNNFFWDNTNKRLGIGTASPAAPLDIRRSFSGNQCINLVNTAADGYTDIVFNKSDTTLQGAIGYGNASVGLTSLRNLNFWYTGGPDIVFANGTKNELTFGMTDGSTFLEMANGSGSAAAGANLGRVRYNTTGQKWQMSMNSTGPFDVALYAAALTTGSVVFADANNRLAQDNANLFWDDTNNRLGLGTASPQAQLHVVGGSRFDAQLDLSNISAGSSNLKITATSDTPAVTWGAAAGNEASTTPAGYLEILVGANPRYIPFWA